MHLIDTITIRIPVALLTVEETAMALTVYGRFREQAAIEAWKQGKHWAKEYSVEALAAESRFLAAHREAFSASCPAPRDTTGDSSGIGAALNRVERHGANYEAAREGARKVAGWRPSVPAKAAGKPTKRGTEVAASIVPRLALFTAALRQA